MSDTALDYITDALFEMGAYGSGDPVPSTADANLGLRVFNRELDAWAGLKRYVWTPTFTLYTLTPNHQPHLIGPGLVSPDFAATQRPVRLEGAALVLTTQNPAVDVPMNIRDAEWWKNQRVKGIATTVPTDLYYEPDWPNGALWLWPVPTFAYGLRLETWTLIAQLASLASVCSFPPGYKKAFILTLAENLCGPFQKAIPADLARRAAKARADIQTNNLGSPIIASADWGATGVRGGQRGDFNYYSGQPN